MKKVLLKFLVIIVIGFVGFTFYNYSNPVPSDNTKITNFDECVLAGYPAQESYPMRCSTNDGQVFTQNIGNELEMQDQIIVDSPRPNQVLTNPYTIQGSAVGSWYFEASFTVKLLDGNGAMIAIAPVQTQGDWMTEDFVPFRLGLEFNMPATAKGTLVFKKSNPSGLPEFDDKLVIPVKFK